MRRSEQSRQSHHDRELREQQARAARDATPLDPVTACETLLALAGMARPGGPSESLESAGSIVVKMARLGAFAGIPDARAVLMVHAAKPPTASRYGAWADFAHDCRKHRGLPVSAPWETFADDAEYAAQLIETDPALKPRRETEGELAQRAAAQAVLSIDKDLDALRAKHPHGWVPGSKPSKEFATLVAEKNEKERLALAAHGFNQAPAAQAGVKPPRRRPPRHKGEGQAPKTKLTFHPANWFGKKMAGRLRMASLPERKTKRVRKVTRGGVVMYCVDDARQWWPRDVPAEG